MMAPAEKPQLTVTALMELLADSKRHEGRRDLRKSMRDEIFIMPRYPHFPGSFERCLWQDFEFSLNALRSRLKYAHVLRCSPTVVVAYVNAFHCWDRIKLAVFRVQEDRGAP